MSNTLTRVSAGKSHLESLRKQAQEQIRRMEELMQRLNSALAAPPPPPRASRLDDIAEVEHATRDLRVGNGNLSADRVAKLFGISSSELANWLGRSRQAISKTPDADSLQTALAFFERVARARLLLKDNQAFRKWLRTPLDALENESPLQLMAQSEWQTMADFVDDLLTGAPA